MAFELRYEGLSNVPSDYACQEGDSAALIDLSIENGELRPFVHPKKIMDIQGRLVCVHRGSGYENYLSLDNGTLYWQTKEETAMGERHPITEGVSSLSKIEVLGNTLILLSDHPLLYVLFKEGQYKVLGEQPPLLDIQFQTRFRQFEWDENNNPITPQEIRDRQSGSSSAIRSTLEIELPCDLPTDKSTSLDEEQQNKVTQYVMAGINPALAAYRKAGYYCFPAFIRHALRLYDGSLTRHSAPILLFCHSSTLGSSPNVDPAEGLSEYDNIVSCYLTAANKARLTINGYSILMHWPGFNSDWSDVVQSVDFFMSAPIYTYMQSDAIERTTYFPSTNRVYIDLPSKDRKDVDEEIYTCGQFYKVYSIPSSGKFSDFGDDYEVSSPKEIGMTDQEEDIPFNEYFAESVLSTIEQQELMEDEYRSHHRLSSEVSYLYNARLHIANVTQTFFEGFSWGQMTAGRHHFLEDRYWSVTSLYIDVYLKTTEKQAHIRYSCQEEIALRPDIQFLYYPDSRAYRMIITLQKVEDAGTEQYYAATLELEEHTTLNGAYYYEPLYYTIESKLKPTTTVPEPPSDDELTSTTPNQLFVSESSNPFLFRAGQIYTIGSSEILAVASATKALSEGQFGQFPLYVFSKEGIWAMEVSQTGSYSSRQTIARDVCNNAKSILQTDGAVLFTSDKGVMIIEGSNVRCISEGLHGPVFDLQKLFAIDEIAQATGSQPLFEALKTCIPFRSYITSAQMAYDYPNSRILIFNTEYPYAYLFNLLSGLWSMITSDYTSMVNDFPRTYLTNRAGEVADLSAVISDDDPTEVQGLVITRPLKFGAPDTLKTIHTVIHRGNFNPHHISTVIYASRDGVHYAPIKSGLGAFLRYLHGSPYKFFRLLFVIEMKRKEALTLTTLEATEKFTNKLR